MAKEQSRDRPGEPRPGGSEPRIADPRVVNLQKDARVQDRRRDEMFPVCGKCGGQLGICPH